MYRAPKVDAWLKIWQGIGKLDWKCPVGVGLLGIPGGPSHLRETF